MTSAALLLPAAGAELEEPQAHRAKTIAAARAIAIIFFISFPPKKYIAPRLVSAFGVHVYSWHDILIMPYNSLNCKIPI